MKFTKRHVNKEQVAWTLFKWLYPDADRTTVPRFGVVGYTYYVEGQGWQTWFPSQLDHNFIAQVLNTMLLRYGNPHLNADTDWLALYGHQLSLAVKPGCGVLLATVEEKAAALAKTLRIFQRKIK